MVTKPWINGLFITEFRSISIIGKSLRENQDVIFKFLKAEKVSL